MDAKPGPHYWSESWPRDSTQKRYGQLVFTVTAVRGEIADGGCKDPGIAVRGGKQQPTLIGVTEHGTGSAGRNVHCARPSRSARFPSDRLGRGPAAPDPPEPTRSDHRRHPTASRDPRRNLPAQGQRCTTISSAKSRTPCNTPALRSSWSHRTGCTPTAAARRG